MEDPIGSIHQFNRSNSRSPTKIFSQGNHDLLQQLTKHVTNNMASMVSTGFEKITARLDTMDVDRKNCDNRFQAFNQSFKSGTKGSFDYAKQVSHKQNDLSISHQSSTISMDIQEQTRKISNLMDSEISNTLNSPTPKTFQELDQTIHEDQPVRSSYSTSNHGNTPTSLEILAAQSKQEIFGDIPTPSETRAAQLLSPKSQYNYKNWVVSSFISNKTDTTKLPPKENAEDTNKTKSLSNIHINPDVASKANDIKPMSHKQQVPHFAVKFEVPPQINKQNIHKQIPHQVLCNTIQYHPSPLNPSLQQSTHTFGSSFHKNPYSNLPTNKTGQPNPSTKKTSKSSYTSNHSSMLNQSSHPTT